MEKHRQQWGILCNNNRRRRWKLTCKKLDDEARIEAINAFRQVLHHYSPFRSQPVDCVLWVKQELVAPNDYNPNNVAPPEKRLLQTSLEADGFTQPVVVIQQRPQAYTIVDGFHRHELACSKAALKKTLKRLFAGDLPDE